MNIIIVDDSKTFLEASSLFVETKLGHKVIAQFNSPLDFLKYRYIHEADCVLIDIEMPEMNGMDSAKAVLNENNLVKFIAITNHFEKSYMKELIMLGFKGCVYKNELFKNLSKAITEVTNGSLFFPDNIK